MDVYKRVIEEGFPDTYRLLCWNCNCAIGIYGECPHKNPFLNLSVELRSDLASLQERSVRDRHLVGPDLLVDGSFCQFSWSIFATSTGSKVS